MVAGDEHVVVHHPQGLHNGIVCFGMVEGVVIGEGGTLDQVAAVHQEGIHIGLALLLHEFCRCIRDDLLLFLCQAVVEVLVHDKAKEATRVRPW